MEAQTTRNHKSWAMPVALGVLLCLMIAWRASRPTATEPPVPSQPSQATELDPAQAITVVLDVGQGEPATLLVEGEPTDALAVLRLAGQRQQRFRPVVQQSGPDALVTAIGGLEGEGWGGRNWLFSVNGKLGDRSAAVTPVGPGDRVLWKYSSQE